MLYYLTIYTNCNKTHLSLKLFIFKLFYINICPSIRVVTIRILNNLLSTARFLVSFLLRLLLPSNPFYLLHIHMRERRYNYLFNGTNNLFLYENHSLRRTENRKIKHCNDNNILRLADIISA